MVAARREVPSAQYGNICSDMRWTPNDFRRVKDVLQLGLSDYQVAKITGVPRSTVLRWRRREALPVSTLRAAPPLSTLAVVDVGQWQVADPRAYCYLLGCYLGDGHVTHKPPNAWMLRVSCDRNYTAIIDEIRAAMATTFPGRRSTRFACSQGASDVLSICHPAIGRAFPQHGPGKKHLRPIVLEPWQLEFTHAHPAALLRGLVHSDGCRSENRFRTPLPGGRIAEYSYIRYFFSNLSADIRQIFIDHCELLGIRVTQSNHRNLSVSHRDSVAILERIVGPKS